MRLVPPRLRAQIVKELLSILRDPRSRTVLIVPPLMQLLVFSFAVTLEVRNVDIAVYDQDQGRWSTELVARIGAAGFVHRLHPVHDQAALARLIDDRTVIAALAIPPDFSRRVERGETAEAQLLLDGRRANAAQITNGYVSTIAQQLGARIRGGEAGGAAAGEAVALRHWFNPNLIYRWFVVPGLSGILTTTIALLLTALSIARERELGTFDQLLVSPTTPGEIILAKTVPALIIGSLLGTIMILAGIFGFGIPFTGSFPLLIASLMLFILSVVGVGLVISSLCATQQQAILGTFAVVVPMILMSGFATPVDNMPSLLRWMAEAIPLKHFLIIVEGSFVKALPASEVAANLWPLAVIAAVTLTVAVIFVRGRLQ